MPIGCSRRRTRRTTSSSSASCWRRSSPALGAGLRARAAADGPRLVTEAVEVPLAEYVKLSVEDFMVSLYNGHTVQRVRLVLPDGSRLAIHEVLAEAIEALRAQSR